MELTRNKTFSLMDDWQNGHSILETNLYMLEHNIACDIVLVAGDDKQQIPAHKFMLISRSPVFYKMFCGALPETGQEVAIPEIDATTINSFLRYIYTQEIEIGPDSVMGLMYTAKKYSVQALVEECSSYLQTEMSTENVCTILEQAHMFDETELQEHCFDMIFRDGTKVFTGDCTDFYNLCSKCLKKVLESDKLIMKEEDIYLACVQWAGNQCKQKGIEVNGEVIRDCLGELLFLIRFPNMCSEFFTEHVSTENVLTDNEKVAVYQQICLPRSRTGGASFYRETRESFVSDQQNGTFSSKPRQLVNILRVNRFGDIAGSIFDFWQNDNLTDAISFSSSKDIKLVGISVFCPFKDGLIRGSVSVYDESNWCMTRRKNLKVSFNESKYYDIEFTSSIRIEQKKWYTISQQMQGAKSYLGRKGQRQVVCKSVTFEFRKSPMTNNETDVDCGQIPVILYA